MEKVRMDRVDRLLDQLRSLNTLEKVFGSTSEITIEKMYVVNRLKHIVKRSL
jgi:hypothetical protein